MREDQRVIALNEYVKKLQDELKAAHLQIIKQCEYIVEQDIRRKRFYERIAKGQQIDPITKTDAEYYLEQINDSIVGMHKTILQQKEKLSEQNKTNINT